MRAINHNIIENFVIDTINIVLFFYLSDHKSWSIARSSNFSYSDKSKFSPGVPTTSPAGSQPDDFLDLRHSPTSTDENNMVHKKNLLNSKLRMAGGISSLCYITDKFYLENILFI